jgi:hypothetical protein
MIALDEEWRDIRGFEGLYQVSNLGRVRSIDRTVLRSNLTSCFYKGMIRNFQYNHNGYLVLQLSKDCFHTFAKVHLLVVETFLEGGFVKHIDGDKQNNRIDNLECFCDLS